MKPSPLTLYTDRNTTYLNDHEKARQASSRLSNARLTVFFMALVGFLWFIFKDNVLASLTFVVTGIAAFLALMARHEKIILRERKSLQLAQINSLGMERINGTWSHFPVDGKEFAAEAHPFTSDLDLFGPSSLYQLINTTQTDLGRLRLNEILISPPRLPQIIGQDQNMIQDLAPRLAWRQNFQAAGGFPPRFPGKEDPTQLIAWMHDPSFKFIDAPLAHLLRILPIFSLSFALFAFFKLGSTALMTLPLLLQWLLSAWYGRQQGELLKGLNFQKKNLQIYHDMLELIELEKFTDPTLTSLNQGLTNALGIRASVAIRRLLTIVEYLATRQNPILHFLVNSLFLWDIQWLWQIRKWRNDNASHFLPWLETIARIESLSSLAVLAFENPDWAFPLVAESGPLLEAKLMAHPLIPAKMRVGNDLRLSKPGEVLIITGSNMSGKSTLMRTVGVNLVLAYAGAPVCAQSFQCRPMQIYTSMRLRDDLEKRISSFYAELLKIKQIVEAARSGSKVLFLVDEIFRGTNSKDRHAGAMAVLRQLHDLGASGIVSTHDLELAQLEQMEPGFFRNQHFQETYTDGKIHFDFKIADGVSATTNAMHLLKMVGLG
jgi:MutS domain V